MIRRLRRNERGAVLAEFVIAIVPVLITFFAFVQLSRIATGRIMMKHAAIVGARAGAVVSNQHDNNPGQTGDGKDKVLTAVKASLGLWNKSIVNVQVDVQDQSSTKDPYDWVTVKVTGTYLCTVPLGFLACGGFTKKMEETYKLPHQGANYKL